ncbi:uncharacterized protein LOC112576050 [Pomacea canaliculata]|uniref:uncharacterized protein LOC112576050 n=1 Tax=Pomacea canaliculata TaxID=400727 RepID=UPI000D733A68|nr:uncharacterized protein LOC112576050 [Pomacea canaliculata]
MHLSVDVRMTRQDFKVVRLDDGGTIVVSWHLARRQACVHHYTGYHFNNTVTDRLVVKIPQATPEQRGTYSCHLQSIDVQNFESCELVISTDLVNAGVIVGVIIGVVVLIALVIAIIILLRKWRICSKKVVSEEEYGMLPRKNKEIKMELINFLSTSCKEMYEDIMTRFYFVPSLYVNRNTYKVVEFAGKKVFITQECIKPVLSHDKAMQTILHNLHLLAEDEKEAMFVISQFKYNSYLTTSIDSYHSHQLPRPDTLRKRVKDYGDFDLLIVHRQYGLVVAVVEACVDESGDEKKTTDDTKLQEEIRNGAKRLKNAEHMIRHLLSDTQWDLPVRKTLMLPNVSQQTVEDVLNKQNKGKTKGKIALTMSSTDMSKDTCLCSEQLTSANSTRL